MAANVPGDTNLDGDTPDQRAFDNDVEVRTPAPPKPSPAAPPAPAAALQNVADSTIAATANAADAVKNFASTNTGTTVMFLVLGAVAAFVIAYVLYWLIDRTVNDRAKYLMKASKMPIVATQVTALTDDDRIPGAGNGKRMSFTFWIYIYDINKFQGVSRHILHRGKEESKEDDASPYVVLDENSNKIHVTFAPVEAGDLLKYKGTDFALPTTGSTAAGSSYICDIAEKRKAFCALRGITFDYVPVQRWVHIGVVVNEEVNGGIITAYIDGELVKNSTTTSMTGSSNPLVSVKATKTASVTAIANVTCTANSSVNLGLDISKADISRKGKVYVGGSPASTVGPGFSGMVSRITFFNFDMNAKDMYNDYLQGPIDNLLAKMGLPAYGLQAPVYRIGK